MTPSLRALRYMTEFRCIAEKCPDTCCSGMEVRLSPGDRERVDGALVRGGAGLVRAGAIRDAPDLDPPYVATLARAEGGDCAFLQSDRLCRLICAQGDEALADTCASFPRTYSHSPEGVEVTATLSCPEAARLALTSEGAMDVVETTWPQVGGRAESRPEVGPGELYLRHRELVAAQGRAILAATEVPLSTRLILLGGFGEATAPFFHRGAPELEDAPCAERLNQAFDRAVGGAAAEAWLARREQLLGAGPRLTAAIFSMLLGIQANSSERYRGLIASTLGIYRLTAERLGAPIQAGPGTWPALWRVYQERRAALDSAFGARVDGWLTRYSVNEWHREGYTRSPSLLDHAFRLSLRLATARFLLVGHPALDAVAGRVLAEGGDLTGEEAGVLDAAAVDVVQLAARHLDRDPDVLDLLGASLPPEELQTDAVGRAWSFAQLA